MKNDKEFYDWTEEMVSKTEYWVEANSFESFMLWRDNYNNTPWEEIKLGCCIILGYTDGMPTNLSITWAKIYGKLVGFYYGCSLLVDGRLIDKWLKDKRKTNADNFHICLNDLRK